MLNPTLYRRSDPFSRMRSLMRDFDRGYAPAGAQGAFPAVNLWHGEEGIAITAELPGVEPSDIDISVKENVLTLSGERKLPATPEGARWHRREGRYGKFSRAVRLPFRAGDDRVEARFKDGVLRIFVGRPEEDKPRKIEIKAA
jgi:HSP20 family protein